MLSTFRLLFIFFILGSCARSVTRVTPDTTIDLSGRWNDSDSRMVADQMISELLSSGAFKRYTQKINRKPVILISQVKNRTSEHIDSENYLKKIELAIFNSDLADVVESGFFRDKIRDERIQQQDFVDPSQVAQWGKEAGADLMLFGEMTSETDVYKKNRVTLYQTTLFLTDVETNKRVWYGQKEIKKLVRK